MSFPRPDSHHAITPGASVPDAAVDATCQRTSLALVEQLTPAEIGRTAAMGES